MKQKMLVYIVAALVAVTSCSDDEVNKKSIDPDVIHTGDKWNVSAAEYNLIDQSTTGQTFKSGTAATGTEIVLSYQTLRQAMAYIKTLGSTFKKAFRLLKSKDPLILCSSTAFFATFSLSPIIILLVNLFSLYFKSEKIGYQMFQAIGSTFGVETAKDIELIVNNFMALESNWLITVAGSVFFLFVATTLLTVVKMSIHKLWRIRKKPKKPFALLRQRKGQSRPHYFL